MLSLTDKKSCQSSFKSSLQDVQQRFNPEGRGPFCPSLGLTPTPEHPQANTSWHGVRNPTFFGRREPRQIWLQIRPLQICHRHRSAESQGHLWQGMATDITFTKATCLAPPRASIAGWVLQQLQVGRPFRQPTCTLKQWVKAATRVLTRIRENQME